MLRTLLKGSHQAYTCSCLYQLASLTRIPITITGDLRNQIAGLHTSSAVLTMNRNLKGNKTTIRLGQVLKHEAYQGDGIEEERELIGLSEAGVIIPTLETHKMLIDGVPYSELPVTHIRSSLNNTIMTVTDHTGAEIIARNSCGLEGFKNVKKSTNVAAQATGLTLGLKAVKKGVTTVRVLVKGIGAGRLASIKGLQMAGLKIVSITDNTYVPENGCRPQKVRRL